MTSSARGGVLLGLLLSGTAFGGGKEESWPEFRPSELRVLKQVAVEPPESFRSVEYAEIRCVVRAYVKASGKPSRVDVDSCPDDLHDAVQSSVKSWRWLMPVINGKRSAGQVPMTVRFPVGKRSRATDFDRTYEKKTPDVFKEYDDAELEPRVLPIEVPDHGMVIVEGGLPWTADATDLVLIKRFEPKFPSLAVQQGKYDDVCDVRLVVNKNGAPTDIAISQCMEEFQRATQAAVSRWRWEPPMAVKAEGEEPQPIEARLRFDVEYRAYPDSFYEEEPAE